MRKVDIKAPDAVAGPDTSGATRRARGAPHGVAMAATREGHDPGDDVTDPLRCRTIARATGASYDAFVRASAVATSSGSSCK
jgi:hypothetical protein